ncbi:toxin-antitoxin system YwqK family antitoxin, partial [Myroides injenensis]
KNNGKTINKYYDNLDSTSKKLRNTYFIDKNGHRQGLEKFYFRNGQLNKKQSWKGNQLDGECKIYYLTGELYILSQYKNNTLDGDYIIFDKNQKVIKHDVYNEGVIVQTIQELVNKQSYCQDESFNHKPIIDQETRNQFKEIESIYYAIRKEEETKDENKTKKGFLSGLKKIGKVVVGVQAYQDRKSSLNLKQACEEYYEEAQKITEIARKNLNTTINEFGKYRLESLNQTTGRFLGILKDMNRENSVKEYQILNNIGINTESIQKMKRLDMEATKALKSSATVGALGAAAAMGTPVLVTSTVGALATASTGTAISTLSGAAATNATLAWLGGGSLASGGGGVAAGATVLSGITMGATAGVGLIVAGLIASTYYSKKLTEAKEYQKQVETHVADMEVLWSVLDGINIRTNELSNVTKKLEVRIRAEIDYLEPLSVDYVTDNMYYNIVFQRLGLLAKSMSELAQTPLLDETGNTSVKSAQIIQNTNQILNTNIVNYG